MSSAEYIAARERAYEAVTPLLLRADAMTRSRVDLVKAVIEASVRAALNDGGGSGE